MGDVGVAGRMKAIQKNDLARATSLNSGQVYMTHCRGASENVWARNVYERKGQEQRAADGQMS